MRHRKAFFTFSADEWRRLLIDRLFVRSDIFLCHVYPFFVQYFPLKVKEQKMGILLLLNWEKVVECVLLCLLFLLLSRSLNDIKIKAPCGARHSSVDSPVLGSKPIYATSMYSQTLYYVRHCVEKRTKTNKKMPGSGCGSVGRAVASDSRGPQFKSSHRQNLYWTLVTVLQRRK